MYKINCVLASISEILYVAGLHVNWSPALRLCIVALALAPSIPNYFDSER